MIRKFKNRFREVQADFHLYDLIRGASIAFVLRVLSASLAFFLNVVLARKLGAEGSGIFFLVFTIVFVAASIGSVGMEYALVRLVAAKIASVHFGQVLGVYKKAIFYSFVAASFLSILLFFITPWMSQVVFNKPGMEQPLTIMAAAVVPLSLLTLHAYALQGLKKIAASTTVLGIMVPLLTCLGALLFVSDYGINAAVWGYLFATLITLLMARVFWKRAISSLKFDRDDFERSELLASSMPLLGVVVMSLIIAWSPLLFLGVWETSENVGIYSVASRTAMLTSFILVAVNSIAAPKFSSLYQQGDISSLGVVARQSTKLITVLSSPVLLLFLFFPEWILSLFGEQFKGGAVVLMIVAVGQFINVATGSVGFLLMMTGHERLIRNNLIFSAVLGLMLNIFLIPRYGVVGAAVSAAIMLSVQNLIAVVQVWKVLGIMSIPWGLSMRAREVD